MDLFSNNAKTTTAASLTSGDVTLVVPSGHGALFPQPTGGNTFRITLLDPSDGNLEIVLCTARATDTLTIVRAQEGTTAKAFPIGSVVSHRLTAQTLNAIFLRDGSTPMTNTGSLRISKGTTAERPAAGADQEAGIRLNKDTGKFEGTSDGTNWSGLGGGATGGGSDEIFLENGQTVTQDYTLPAGKNAVTAGKVTIADGVKATLAPGSRWAIV